MLEYREDGQPDRILYHGVSSRSMIKIPGTKGVHEPLLKEALWYPEFTGDLGLFLFRGEQSYRFIDMQVLASDGIK